MSGVMQESSDTYNAAMAATGEALVQAASAVLTKQAQEQLSFEGDSDEFGQRLCETMAEFGSSHLHALASHDAKILFLQQVRFHYQSSYSAKLFNLMSVGASVLHKCNKRNRLFVRR